MAGYKKSKAWGDSWGGGSGRQSSYNPTEEDVAVAAQKIEASQKDEGVLSLYRKLGQAVLPKELLDYADAIPGNAKQDFVNFYKGLPLLAGMALKIYAMSNGVVPSTPENVGEVNAFWKQCGESLKDYYKGYAYKNGELSAAAPLNQFKEHPLFVPMDVLGAVSLGTGALGKVASIAGAGLSRGAEMATISTAGDIGRAASIVGDVGEAATSAGRALGSISGVAGKAGEILATPFTPIRALKLAVGDPWTNIGKLALEKDAIASTVERGTEQGLKRLEGIRARNPVIPIDRSLVDSLGDTSIGSIAEENIKPLERKLTLKPAESQLPPIDKKGFREIVKADVAKVLSLEKKIPIEQARELVESAKPLKDATWIEKQAVDAPIVGLKERTERELVSTKNAIKVRGHNANQQAMEPILARKEAFKKQFGRLPAPTEVAQAYEIAKYPKSMRDAESLKLSNTPEVQMLSSHVRQFAQESGDAGIAAGHFSSADAFDRKFMPLAYELADKEIMGYKRKFTAEERNALADSYKEQLKQLPPEDTADMHYWPEITRKGESTEVGVRERHLGNVRGGQPPGFTKHYEAGQVARLGPYEAQIRWWNSSNRAQGQQLSREVSIKKLQENNLGRILRPGELKRGDEITLNLKTFLPEAEAEPGSKLAVPKNMQHIFEGDKSAVAGSRLVAGLDIATSLYKKMVLNFPRWIKNNFIGNNVFLGVMVADHPMDFLHASKDMIWGKYRGKQLRTIMTENVPEIMQGFAKSEGWFTTTQKELVNKIFMPKEDVIEITAPSGHTYRVQDYNARHWFDLLGTVANKTDSALNIMMRLNEAVETPYRQVAGLMEFRRAAREQIRADKIMTAGFKAGVMEQLIKENMVDIMLDPQKSLKVSKALGDTFFNYWDLNQTERAVLNRGGVFYPWYKNMFKFAYWTLPMKHPAKAAMLAAMSRTGIDLWRNQLVAWGINPDDLPSYLIDAVPVGIDRAKGTITLFSLRGEDLFNTVSGFNWKQALSMANPIAKILVERGMYEDTFSGRKFDSPHTYEDQYTGQMWGPTSNGFGKIDGINPPLLEHMDRQSPQYQILKDAHMALKYHGLVPATYSAEGWNATPRRTKTGEFTKATPFLKKELQVVVGLQPKEIPIPKPKERKAALKGVYKKELRQLLPIPESGGK